MGLLLANIGLRNRPKNIFNQVSKLKIKLRRQEEYILKVAMKAIRPARRRRS